MHWQWMAGLVGPLALSACSVGVAGPEIGLSRGDSAGVGDDDSGSADGDDDAGAGSSGTGDTGLGGDESETGAPACDAPDLSSDPEHCGACNHGCLGGACLDGRCQPVVLASGFEFPNDLKLLGSQVFFSSNSGLASVPKDGGATALVASGVARWLAVDSDTVYWINEDAARIQSIRAEGGAITTVVTGLVEPWAIALDDESVYWTDQGIKKSSKLGGAPQTLAPEPAAGIVPMHIVIGDGRAYWRTWSGELMSVGTDGGVPQVLASAQQMCSVAFGDGQLFTLQAAPTCNDLARLVRVPIGAGVEQELIAGQREVYPMIVHDGHVLWRTQTNGVSDILRMPVDGGDASVLVSTQGLTIGMAVDDVAMYWANGDAGTIMKVAL